MTNEEINKAIAEHLGWKLCEREVQGLNEVYWVPPGVITHLNGKEHKA